MSDVVSLSSLAQSGAGSQIQLERSHPANETEGPSSETAARQPLTDSVDLSGSSGLLQQALSAGASARSAQVQFLKQQFQSGQYEINAEMTASAVLNGSIAGE